MDSIEDPDAWDALERCGQYPEMAEDRAEWERGCDEEMAKQRGPSK